MIRIAGCCLVIGATSLWGMDKARRLKEEIAEIHCLQRFIYCLHSEMSYSKTFLADVFERMSSEMKRPYDKWLCELSEQLNNYPLENFTNIWKESIEKHFRAVRIGEKEKEGLQTLGNHLGTADLQIQLKLLETYARQLEYEINEKQTERKTKEKVYLSLGVMSGLFVSVIML